MRASVYLLTAAAVAFTSLSAFANDYSDPQSGALLYTDYETTSVEGSEYISVGEITFVDDEEALSLGSEYAYETVIPAADTVAYEYDNSATLYTGEPVDAASTMIETIDGITYETILAPTTTY